MRSRLSLLLLATLCSLAPGAPLKLIFDTDMGNDLDDVMALAMNHNLKKRGAVDQLAATVTKDHPQAAAFVDAVNTFYGYPDVSIGVVRKGATPARGKLNALATAENPDGTPRFPHDLLSGADAPEAVGLLRRLLAAQSDASVVRVQVGFLTNFARLIETPPDAHSPLSGRDLIARK